MSRATLAVSVMSIAVGTLIMSSSAPAARQDKPAPPTTAATASAAAAKPKAHTVAAGDLVLSLERDGRIDSASRVKVRLLPDAFGGGFEVAEVAKTGGRVKKGDVILRMDAEKLDKAIDDARVEVDHAERRMKLAQSERQVMTEANATRIEQSERSRVRAEKSLEIWDKYDGPDMLRGADLGIQGREFNLADEQQELSQLEEMYSGTHLAQETKDIVLDRARRGLMMNHEYLKLAKNDDTVARQYRHPMQDEQVRDALRWAKEEESHAKIGVANTEERKAMEMENAERGLKDAKEKLADLQADHGLLEVVAPADGVMTRIDLEPRDNVAARQTICEVLNPGDLVAKFSLQPEDLRIVAPADGEGVKQLTLRLPDFPEVQLTGTIIEMAEMVSSGGSGGGGEANSIPVTVKIEGATNPLVRLGLKCKASAQRTIKDVLLVPKEAVKWEGGVASVQLLKADGASEPRTVTVGPSNDKMTMIMQGLTSGDQVVIEDKK